MPLKSGSSRAVISSNVAELRHAGHSAPQSAAIAYKEAGKDEGFAEVADALTGMAGDESEEDREGEKNEPQVHDSAGLVFVAPNGHVLFLRRDSQASHGGQWDWPGGHLQPGETLLQGAIRESHEECGYLAPADKVREMSRAITEDMDFTTFVCPVDEMFTPNISRDEFGHREHDDWRWCDPRDPPQPLHPGIEEVLGNPMIEEIIKKGDVDPEEAAAAEDSAWAMIAAAIANDDLLALDKSASVRSYDVDGRLHVSLTPITKAAVNPYLGHEIPGWQKLGLDPDRVYHLLRAPEEIERAVATSNGIPLLEVHKPTSSEKHPKSITVGATGTDAIWQAPYLFNSLVIWPDDAIEGVESEEKIELSSSYHYVPDMTPGTWEGQHFDGTMRDLVFNHVALVEQGRAGSDVAVADSFGDDVKWALIEEALTVPDPWAPLVQAMDEWKEETE
jgi:uncharacterized protein